MKDKSKEEKKSGRKESSAVKQIRYQKLLQIFVLINFTLSIFLKFSVFSYKQQTADC